MALLRTERNKYEAKESVMAISVRFFHKFISTS